MRTRSRLYCGCAVCTQKDTVGRPAAAHASLPHPSPTLPLLLLIQRRSQTALQAFYDLTAGIDDDGNEDGSSPSAPRGVTSGEEMNTHIDD